MSTKPSEPLSEAEIIDFFEKLVSGSTDNEEAYLQEYRSAIDKSQYFLSLLDDATEKGTEVRVHTFTFDMEENEYLAEICPDGESGFVALDKFFDLYFVRYVQYGEGGENFGPWSSIDDASLAFEQAVLEFKPG